MLLLTAVPALRLGWQAETFVNSSAASNVTTHVHAHHRFGKHHTWVSGSAYATSYRPNHTLQLYTCARPVLMQHHYNSNMCMLQGRFDSDNFTQDVVDVAQKLVPLTVTLWNKVSAKMLPTPAKFHYLFNMRELSKVGTLSTQLRACSDRMHLNFA